MTQLSRQQQKSLFKWFEMISQEADRQGVTFDMVIRHTHQLKITKPGLHAMCKQLIRPLFGYESTTEIQKTGDLDIIIDHFTDLLSKEMEVPPFPHDPDKQAINKRGYKLAAHEASKLPDYPEQDESTMGDKF
jgi:hypothetical protein